MNPQFLRRLLHLFPIKFIRAEWPSIQGRTKDDVIRSVVSEINIQNILEFVRASSGVTKQHVYLFEHTIRNLRSLPDSVLSSWQPVDVRRHQGAVEYFYLVPLVFEFFSTPPPSENSMQFPWPIKIRFNDHVVQVNLTACSPVVSPRALILPASMQSDKVLARLRTTVHLSGKAVFKKSTAPPIRFAVSDSRLNVRLSRNSDSSWG